MCEIIGMITEIVSNQYHFAVLNQKVIALQRFFNFSCPRANPFSLISMAKQVGDMNIKLRFYLHIFSAIQGFSVHCVKK